MYVKKRTYVKKDLSNLTAAFFACVTATH